MMPGRYPMIFYRGDSYQWRVIVWLDAQRTKPFDMTGMVAKAEIRAEPRALKWWLISTTITLPNIIDCYLSTGTSYQLPNDCVWDLQMNTIDNQVFTILRGNVQVVDDVTDSRVVPVATPSSTGLTPFPKRGVRVA